MAGRRGLEPRTFFLNEQHEPARGEKKGGGSLPRYAPIDWSAKATHLNRSLRAARTRIQRSPDPLRESRFYLVALPERGVEKVTEDKRHPDGRVIEETDYASQHSMVFRRLGLDLIDVPSERTAIVHATRERLEQLEKATASLASEGPRLKSRFMTIESFGVIPSSLRVDDDWVESLPINKLTDTVVELQPLLTRTEFDDVIRAIKAMVRSGQEAFVAAGADFSGRQWVRGRLRRQTIEAIAKGFYSVQSIHAPLYSKLAATKGQRTTRTGAARPVEVAVPRPLPCVAVVDAGVPAEHPYLSQYRRPNGYMSPDAPFPYLGDHGSLVASRIVYGDMDAEGECLRKSGQCTFFDVMLGQEDARHSGSGIRIDGKGLITALEAVVAVAPDIRVFNLSFGDRRPLGELDEIERRERLILTQDLDNFIFARDVLVVICAGNSRRGIVPSNPYPRHVDDPAWALGAWASGFNTLTCGAAVEHVVPDALAKNVDWPSPFTRIGPALPGDADAPVPEFGAHGGNCDEQYAFRPAMGVWGLNAEGQLED
ncbi:MAG: S8 family serine peptidase, partial [Polyangiaceae bacterium]|nr:S8 family serine peptidase [Polyangiaceae bacterium]